MKYVAIERLHPRVLFWRWLNSWLSLFEALLNIVTFGTINVWISLITTMRVIKAQCDTRKGAK